MPKQPKKAVAKKPAAKTNPKTDWVAVLRSGAAGVRKWNKLSAPERAQALILRADFSGCALAGAKLADVRADEINLTGADLTGATLNGFFGKATFTSANLTEVRAANLQAVGADFSGAKLVRADLQSSGLKRCSFVGADLTGARMERAELHGADFTAATLADVMWTGAEFDAETKWPTDFAVPGELKWAGRTTDPRLVGKGKRAAAHDINGLMARLHATIDEKRMTRVLDMLKKERNQIFSEVEPTLVRGIVRSQRDIDTIYSCVLTEDGTYSCCTPDLKQCMGLSDEPCKHLLVLLIGLARAGQLDATTADKWVVAAGAKNPRWNKTVKNHMADSLLKYKGAAAGEIDWRPTETIPEDFYAM